MTVVSFLSLLFFVPPPGPELVTRALNDTLSSPSVGFILLVREITRVFWFFFASPLSFFFPPRST